MEMFLYSLGSIIMFVGYIVYQKGYKKDESNGLMLYHAVLAGLTNWLGVALCLVVGLTAVLMEVHCWIEEKLSKS